MTTTSKYLNGNTTVTILPDGTKIREYDGVPLPQFPESIDVKITDYCDAGCAYCHERSTTHGVHGDMGELVSLLVKLPAGVELAIGGGNPLSHPQLIPFLTAVKQIGLIANITINQRHLWQFQSLIAKLVSDELVSGVGVSVISSMGSKYFDCIKSPNVVFHLIAGVNHTNDIDSLVELGEPCRILVLGYKDFGRGIKYHSPQVDESIALWKMYLPRYFSKRQLSFDNLAIEQLGIRKWLTDEAWQGFYMGDDGEFSMYLDAVKMQYAKTSRSTERTRATSCSIEDYFQSIRASH